MAQKAGILKIPQSTEVSEAAAVAEVMIVGDAVENTEVKILTLTILRALSVTCSETARSSKRLEISETEEKKIQEKEKKKKEKRKKGQRIFPQDDKKGGKKLPAEKTPHQNSSFVSLQSSMFSQKKNAVAQRISSARLHKIKELKNEIFDLQHQLEASSLENRVLKQLQCRHLKAIGRYENSESNLQDLLARHYDEVRSLRKLLRMSQEDERNTSRKLRKVEAELLKAKDALQALHLISEDKALAEREELNHRLSVLTEKMEVNDRRIQSLEKQLKLNNSTFSRQLANENKKAVEAGIITKNLQMEINSLHQKIKEKDRQLYVKNIYANRMPKIPNDKGDSEPPEKNIPDPKPTEELELSSDEYRRALTIYMVANIFAGKIAHAHRSLQIMGSKLGMRSNVDVGLGINRSVQVDKQRFRSLLLSQYQTQETEESPIQLTKEKKSSKDKSQKAEANEADADAQCRAEKQSIKKIPKPETFNRTRREYLREGRLLMEEYTCLEFMKEEKERDLLKQELETLMKTEQTPLSDSVKENNKEEGAVGEHEKEEKKPDEELSNGDKSGSKRVTPSPRNKTFIGLKNKYIFSEATENLHHGLPTSGTKPKKGSLCNHRCAGRDHSERAESKVKSAFGLYEPSFGRVAETRWKASSTEAEGCARMTFADRKNSLTKELFGPGCV